MVSHYPEFHKLEKATTFCGIDIETTAIDPITKDIDKIWSIAWDYSGVPRAVYWEKGITKAELYNEFFSVEARAVLSKTPQHYELLTELKEILIGTHEVPYTPCFHSAQFDGRHLQQCLEETLAPFICTQQLAYIVMPPTVMGCEGDEEAMRHYSLTALARKGLCGAKLDYDGGWDKFTPDMLAYNKQDATSCRQLATNLFPIIQRDSNLWNAFIIDMCTVWMTTHMTDSGCLVDSNALTEFQLEVEQDLRDSLEEMRTLCPAVATKEVTLRKEPKKKMTLRSGGIYDQKDIGGHIIIGRDGWDILCKVVEEFNPNCAEHLLVYLKRYCDFTPKKFSRKTNKPTLDKAVISELAEVYQPAALVQKHRTAAKLLSTYLKPFRESDEVGRIHPNFLTCNTRTGRLSSTRPNFQNIPRGKCRELIIAPKGKKIVCIDLSQVELRILAWYMAALLKGKERSATFMWEQFSQGRDIHDANAKLIGKDRKLVKVGIFLYIYGGTEARMSASLGLSLPDAKDFMRALEKQLPALPALRKLVHQLALKERTLYTLYGHSIIYPSLFKEESTKFKRLQCLRQYFNATIQGSQADIMKILMWQVRRLMIQFGAIMLIQVHDELVFEVPESNAPLFCEGLLPLFNNTYLLKGLVVKATPGVGNTWAEAKQNGEDREKNDDTKKG